MIIDRYQNIYNTNIKFDYMCYHQAFAQSYIRYVGRQTPPVSIHYAVCISEGCEAYQCTGQLELYSWSSDCCQWGETVNTNIHFLNIT